MVNPVLREKNPALANHVQTLLDNFERAYEMDDSMAERANFVEGVNEFARLMAGNAVGGRLAVTVGDSGVCQIVATVMPKS